MEKLRNSLKESYKIYGGINIHHKQNLPSRESVSLLLEQVKDILFPGYLYHNFNENNDFFDTLDERLQQIQGLLEEQLFLSLVWKNNEEEKDIDEENIRVESKDVSHSFLNFYQTAGPF